LRHACLAVIAASREATHMCDCCRRNDDPSYKMWHLPDVPLDCFHHHQEEPSDSSALEISCDVQSQTVAPAALDTVPGNEADACSGWEQIFGLHKPCPARFGYPTFPFGPDHKTPHVYHCNHPLPTECVNAYTGWRESGGGVNCENPKFLMKEEKDLDSGIYCAYDETTQSNDAEAIFLAEEAAAAADAESASTADNSTTTTTNSTTNSTDEGVDSAAAGENNMMMLGGGVVLLLLGAGYYMSQKKSTSNRQGDGGGNDWDESW